MRHETGWQHKATRHARDWDDRPPPEPKAHGPWEHLIPIAVAAALIGVAAGASLVARDRIAHDHVLAVAGFAPDGSPALP